MLERAVKGEAGPENREMNSLSTAVETLQQKVETIRHAYYYGNKPCNLPTAESALELSPPVAAALVEFVDDFLTDMAREEEVINYYETQRQEREAIAEKLKGNLEHVESQMTFLSGQLSMLSEKRQQVSREIDAIKKHHNKTLVDISTKRERVRLKSKMAKIELERLQKIAKRNHAVPS